MQFSQLADVARPVVIDEELRGGAREALHERLARATRRAR